MMNLVKDLVMLVSFKVLIAIARFYLSSRVACSQMNLHALSQINLYPLSQINLHACKFIWLYMLVAT